MIKSWSRPGKILVAIDLTPQSELALNRAIALSAQWGARLYVLHAVDDERIPRGEAAARTKAAEAEIERMIRGNPAATSVEVDILTTLGNPAKRILAKCDRLFVDLCVMGSGERRTLGQKLLGTTVDHVLRNAFQPVLSVRKPISGPYRKITIATDFSPPSRTAFDCALAFFPNCDTTVLHAYEVALHGLFEFDRMTGPVAEKHEREMTQHVGASLRSFVEQARASGTELSPVSAIGDPRVILPNHAEQNGIDLVVVGTHGRTGVRRAVLGSVAERLIGTMPCDVLAVRARE